MKDIKTIVLSTKKMSLFCHWS